MNGNVRSAMFISFSAITFISALSISFFLFRSVYATNELTYKVIHQSDKNMQTTLKIPTTYKVSGSEVRQSIFMIRDIDVDIVVGGVTFAKTLDPMTVDVSSISLNRDYTPTYVRDTNGNLTLVRYN